MRNDKGITMTTLIISVLIILILCGVSLGFGNRLIKNTKLAKIIANMTLVQIKAKEIYEDNQFNGAELVGNNELKPDLNKVSDEEEKKIIESGEWYQWNADILKKLGLDSSILKNEQDCFYVNYKSEEIEVVYNAGYKDTDTGNHYYTLTMLNKIYKKNISGGDAT